MIVFSVVRNWARENNYLVIEYIREHNLYGEFCANTEFVSESRVQYFTNWDPVISSMPCLPKRGNMLPIYWSTNDSDEQVIRIFSLLL